MHLEPYPIPGMQVPYEEFIVYANTIPEVHQDQLDPKTKLGGQYWNRCMTCEGYGTFNTILWKYPHCGPDTPQNRAWSHSTTWCKDCQSFGTNRYVKGCHAPGTQHQWQYRTVGRCLTEMKCAGCGYQKVIDSGD